MTDIENLDSDTRDKLFFLIDNVVQKFKAKRPTLDSPGWGYFYAFKLNS